MQVCQLLQYAYDEEQQHIILLTRLPQHFLKPLVEIPLDNTNFIDILHDSKQSQLINGKSLGNVANPHICLSTLLEILKRYSHFCDGMPSTHPKELRCQFLNSVTYYYWHLVVQHYWDDSIVVVTTQLFRQLALDQAIVEIFFTCFDLFVGILQVSYQFFQFLTMELRDVLENNTNILRVVWAFEFFVVGCVLQDYGLAEIVDGWGIQYGSTLLQCFFVVSVVSYDHVHTVQAVLHGPFQNFKAYSLDTFV